MAEFAHRFNEESHSEPEQKPQQGEGRLTALDDEFSSVSMLGSSAKNRQRFKDIQRETVKKNFSDIIKNPEKMRETGRGTVRIPTGDGFETPRFKFGEKGSGGVSAGDGEPGDPMGPGEGDPDQGAGEAGEQAGEFQLEDEVSIDQLADMLGEHLRLPNIKRKRSGSTKEEGEKLRSRSNVGPKSRLDRKATHRKATERTIGILGEEAEELMKDPEQFAEKVIEQYPFSKKYREFKPQPRPQHRAMVGFIMDVSGSMEQEQKDLVRTISFWIDTWLRSQYDDVEVRYVVHTTEAEEVDQHTFFNMKESGGTQISSAFEKMDEILEDYPEEDWNTYIFQFSDGDNFGSDNDRCMEIARRFMDRVNQFAYGQVSSSYGSGDFYREILREFAGDDDSPLATARIDGRDDIVGALMRFLGGGR